MNKKAILNPVSAENTSERAEAAMRNTIQIDYLRRADELIVLQHVIRRFKLRHEADFYKLLELRKELGDILRETLPKISGDVNFDELHAKALWYCMNFLDDRTNLLQIEQQKLSKDRVKWVFQRLTDHLDEIFTIDTFMHVDDLDLVSLAKVLVNFSPIIADINHRSNFTHFYSILGLTSYIPGSKFYTHYLKAKLRRHPINLQLENPFLDQDSLWMFSTESGRDDDFSVLLNTRCGALLRPSKNIQIFSGHNQSISIADNPVKDRLVFCVPTNEAPDRIDDALRELKAALMQEFIRNCGGYLKVGTEEYSNSVFMTQFAYQPCLIKYWKQIQQHVVGLWCWDIACENGRKITKARDEVLTELENIKNDFGHGLKIYDAKTIETHYHSTNKLIGPRNIADQLKPTEIDDFITRSGKIIGTTGTP